MGVNVPVVGGRRVGRGLASPMMVVVYIGWVGVVLGLVAGKRSLVRGWGDVV